MADLAYYQGLEDYDSIKDYLDLDPENFEVPVEIPDFEPDFSKAILVDNLPTVGAEKIEKLTQVVLKIYAQISDKLTKDDIYMPLNEGTGSTDGFCFIKFPTKEEAEKAVQVTQGFAISKTNLFKVSLYSDLEKYNAYPDEFVPLDPPAFKSRPDVVSWLADVQCRDQFVIRHAHETEIYWANMTGEEPNVIYSGEREKEGGRVWCESYVNWSPKGTYLATFHQAGIKLWGSELFEAQCRFMHPSVELVDFSPCEGYMTTYRYDQSKMYDPEEAMVVWDIRSGAKLRSFALKNPLDQKFQVQAMITEQKERKTANGVEKIITERMVRGRVVSVDERSGKFTIAEGNTQHTDVFPDKVQHIQEPNRLKWSHDGKYLARLGPDVISVYELPSMALLDKKSIAAKDVLDFVWSPKSNMISYWSPAVGNHPSLINIIKVPERTDICSRKIFDVTDGRMVWQNEGDYLCVFMCKITGKKKTFVLMFFRMNEPGVPVEQIELAEPILNVSWEPSGDRLSIVHGEARTPTVSFYSMNGAPAQPAPGGKAGSKTPVKKELTLLFQLKDVQVNDVLWSPAGDVVALAFYAPDTCMFQLYDVENNTMLANRRHDRGNRLAWDPSGRVLASCTINPLKERQVRGHADDGFILYSFQGAVLSQLRREKLYQFQWRPRPKDLMTADERRKVVKNLRKYEKMFEKEDKQRKQELNAELLAARHAQAADFYQIISRNRANNKSLKPRRIDLRRGYDEDDDRNYIFETRIEEIVLSTKEQIIQ